MTAGELYRRLMQRGVYIAAHGDRLRVCDTAGIVTEETLAELRRRKSEILRLLSPDGEAELDAAIYGGTGWIVN